ncbi:AI-2E family transporter [Tropicibacter sp. Alg240-R139]|uniref:AI-2E family transporter n=1 Tax=Tropicibacter sp. Alg240-R139 TaxID=2305991 RepID=UPI0013E08D20|nr:AI-2E family transporter [Tropicibacter sp. Alg240-R139]
MIQSKPNLAENWRWLALILITLLITSAFFQMTLGFMVPLALAAITGAMAQPMNRKIVAFLGGRRNTGSLITLLSLMFLVIAPLFALIVLAISQASALVNNVSLFANDLSANSTTFTLPSWVPFEVDLEDLRQKITERMGTILQAVARFFVASVGQVTVGAATFFLSLFVYFYSLFFFLQFETPIMVQVLRYTGLRPDTQAKLHERIVSVSRATIKGTLSIAFIQGVLGGVSFWLAGIEGAAFWTVVMMVAAVLPGLGAPVVMFIGAAYLAIDGAYFASVGLALWAALVVSTIDNVLRPILVGRDAKLHDVMILISTLGGLSLFGASGLVLGPVLAGLFVTIWHTLAEAVGNTEVLEGEDDQS